MSGPKARRDAQLAEALRAAGLRKTAPRLAVLAVLERAGAPLSHAEVAETLAPEGLDRATVYRNLVALSEAGLARRSDLGDHVWRFERVARGGRAAGAHAHPHLVCTGCGSVSCLEKLSVRFEGEGAALAKRGVEVQLRGPCADCAKPGRRRKIA